MSKTMADVRRGDDALRQEVSGLLKTMADAVSDPELRQEILDMQRTMADLLKEEGRREGEKKAAVKIRQQTLIRLLRRRFGEVPATVVSAVASTTDVDQLDDWLDRLVTADTLDELEIPASRSL